MKKRGQVWVETVIYTLIAFSMIALVLSFAKPKIEELQDKALTERAIASLTEINKKLTEVTQGGAGNKRLIPLEIKKGSLIFEGEENEIYFTLESSYAYSQPGTELQVGSILAKTETLGSEYFIELKLNASKYYDIQFNEEEKKEVLEKAGVPYKIFITNKGKAILSENSCSGTDFSSCPAKENYTAIACETDLCKYRSTKTTINIQVE